MFLVAQILSKTESSVTTGGTVFNHLPIYKLKPVGFAHGEEAALALAGKKADDTGEKFAVLPETFTISLPEDIVSERSPTRPKVELNAA